MPVRLRRCGLPRPGQEHSATGHAVCLAQSKGAGMSAPAVRAKTPEWAEMNEIESNTSEEIVASLSAFMRLTVARGMQTIP